MKVTSRKVLRTGKLRTYQCDGCSQQIKLRPGMHWCDCNPGAPWRLVELQSMADINRMLSAMLTKEFGR